MEWSLLFLRVTLVSSFSCISIVSLSRSIDVKCNSVISN